MQTEGGLEASCSDLLVSRIDLGLRDKGLQLSLSIAHLLSAHHALELASALNSFA